MANPELTKIIGQLANHYHKAIDLFNILNLIPQNGLDGFEKKLLRHIAVDGERIAKDAMDMLVKMDIEELIK